MPTFAGRDVFAPAAAHICNGVELGELGPEVDPVLLLPATVPLPRDDGDAVVAEVLWVDRFGNCQLNVGPEDLPATWAGDVQLRIGSATDPAGGVVRRAVRASSFAALGPGQPGLVLDSYGMLAVCLDRRSAAEELGLAAGDQVLLAALDDAAPAPPPCPSGAATAATGSLPAMRPATTLTLGLLLAAILIAGIVSLVRL